MEQEILAIFAEEAGEMLARLDELFMSLENNKGLEAAEKDETKRLLHNIKGTSYSLGLNSIADLTHLLEEHIAKHEILPQHGAYFLAYVDKLREFLTLTENGKTDHAVQLISIFFDELQKESEKDVDEKGHEDHEQKTPASPAPSPSP